MPEKSESPVDVYDFYNFDDFSDETPKNNNESDDNLEESSDTVSDVEMSNLSSSDSLDFKNVLKENDRPEQFLDLDSNDSSNRIREGDNLIAVATCVEKVGTMDFFIFNDETKDLFAHHDILVKYEPICLEYVDCDNFEEYGGLVALCYSRPGIDFFDMSAMDIFDPIFTLGSHSMKKQKSPRIKNDHTKAVTCIHWNRLSKNLFGSCSVDGSSIIWDLYTLKPTQYVKISKKSERSLDAIKWNSFAAHQYLTLESKGIIRTYDYRMDTYIHKVNLKKKIKSFDSVNGECTIDGDFMIDNILWNRHNEHQFITSDGDGYVSIFDIRNDEIVKRFQAHENEVTAIDMCYFDETYLATVCEEFKINLWDITQPEPELKNTFNLGEFSNPICDIRFSPETPHHLAVCPALDAIKVLDLTPNPDAPSRNRKRLKNKF